MQEVSSWRDITFLNPRDEVLQSGAVMPHWQQPEVACFITFRLADSIPKECMDRWKKARDEWLAVHPRPWTLDVEDEYHRRFVVQIERWLDRLQGACPLRDETISGELEDVITAFHAQRYLLHAWTIMPNHVHVLATFKAGESMDRIVKAWKGTSARRIQKQLGRTGPGFWQKNYFDRLIRDPDHFSRCVRYIRNNPRKAGLKPKAYRLYESSFVQKILG